MNQNDKVMVYKCPGKHSIHGVMCDYQTVLRSEVDDASKDGWCETPTAAAQAVDKPKRKRRTKIEIDAEREAQEEAEFEAELKAEEEANK